ncbi:hypothetical protein [Aquipuribacter hungaricus]|uniref:Reprolysin-like metallo-peptidase family M12B n=1 Tax=Aquipuribacter hungaricus TaxID=545624 RepID=A0ABV7WBM4_9MICO
MTAPLRSRRRGHLIVPATVALLLLSPLAPAAVGSPGTATAPAAAQAAGPAHADAEGHAHTDAGHGDAVGHAHPKTHDHAAGTPGTPGAAADEDPADAAGHAHPKAHDHADAGDHADGEAHAAAHSHDPGAGCEGETVRVTPDAPLACAHADVPPPGVDVTVPVTTAEALSREGSAEAATDAAQELGAPAVVQAAATPSVRCDGDGRSGYRVQAMYVVEVGKVNRYAELLPSLKTWAAGTDTVVNRSAALTGGVRDVRFVHEPGTTDCQPVVLNVTVPAGGLASFDASIRALQAQGYSDPARKYLMWTDATVLCGIALQYLDDQPGQGNANNGLYPQYARTDSGCWGGTYSVEAHELVHTLGGVQRSAPNSTAAGHCRDESDRMCYVDGAGVVMRQVCPGENEALLDCGADDYFSTFPVVGSYLDGRWNSADSRFLVGGGDGTDGGQAGLPTRLGVQVQVNSPGVPGLPTQATAALQLPAGRTAGVAWTVSRADCVLGTPRELQTSVTCPAASTATVTLTATATDSTGQKATAASPLTFATSPRRAAAVVVDVDGATGTSTGCLGATAPVTGTVVDALSGVPVLGVTVEMRRRTATTVAATAGTAVSTVAGRATVRPPLVDGQLWSARTRAVGPFDVAASTADVLVRTVACTATVTLAAAASTAWAGDTVAFSGTAVRTTPAGVSSPVAGATVTLVQTQPGSTTPRTIGTTRTDASGAWSASPVVLASGPVQARLAAVPGSPAATSAAVPMTATPSVTRLVAGASTLSAPYGAPVTVSGTLARDEGGSLSPLAAGRVQVGVTRPGTTTVVALGSAVADASGAWSVVVRPTVAGTLAASYAALPGQPAARTVVGDLALATWSTSTTMAAGPVQVAQGGAVTTTGSVTRTALGTTEPAAAVVVRLFLQPAAGGAEVLLGSTTTRADGGFTLAVRPTQNGAVRARVVGVAGHADSASTTTAVTVAAGVSAAPSTRTPKVGVAFTVRAAVTPAQAAPVVLERQVAGGAWTPVATATTASTGVHVFSVVPTTAGAASYRVTVAATVRTAAAASAATAVTVAP